MAYLHKKHKKKKTQAEACPKTKKKKLKRKDQDMIYAFARRLYYLLRHHSDSIYFQKLYGGYLGYYESDADRITIDYRRDIISILVHEALHKWYPEWSETKVRQKEKWIMNRLTPRQIKTIIKIMGNNL